MQCDLKTSRISMDLRLWQKTPMLEFPKIRCTFFGEPHNKDYSILGSILGSPYFGERPCLRDTLSPRSTHSPTTKLSAWKARRSCLPGE